MLLLCIYMCIAAQSDGSGEDENEAMQSQYEKRQHKAQKRGWK